VYLAEDPEGRRVALKELLFALVPGTEQLDAFEREAAVLRSLSHPDIPRFVASFREGSGVGTRLYLAQEFLEGESLQQRLERRRLDEDEAWTLAEQVLETLQALHQRTPALIHRDVKPANLLLRPGGRAALVDFGAARHLSRQVTHGSTLVGTFGYMPPEQLGGTVEPSSDLYALGATLVHALSGRAPADLLDDRLALSFEGHVQVSDALRAFLRRLLAPRRSVRFGSAAEALMALRTAREVAPSGATSVERNVHSKRGRGDSPGTAFVEWNIHSGPGEGHPPGTAAVERNVHSGPSAPGTAAVERNVHSGPSGGHPPGTAPVERNVHSGALQAPPAGTSVEEATARSARNASPLSRRRALRWALVGVSVAGLLAGALLASGALAPSAPVVVNDPPDWRAPPQVLPAPAPPARPAPPSGNGSHRHFRTPWPGASGSR
jgi:serine/threonine protein kinase